MLLEARSSQRVTLDSNNQNQAVVSRGDIRKRRADVAKQAAAPLVAALREEGFQVEWVADLFNQKMDYRPVVPMLLHWLPKMNNTDVKEDIVRALTVKWAKPQAARPLVEEFRKASPSEDMGLRWAIGNALATVSDDSILNELVELATDASYGRSREMVAIALGNLRNPQATEVLIDLLDDPEIAGHALIALGKLRPKEAKPRIERMLNDPKPWVRKEAQKLLNKLD